MTRSTHARPPRPPERFDATPSEIRLPAPMLAEHSREILGALGLDAAEPDRLHSEGIIR